MGSSYLFPKLPKINFSPISVRCVCGNKLKTLKTNKKNIATLEIGLFQVNEMQKICNHCGKIYRSDELRSLTPHGGKYGFDIIEYIGRALFVKCRGELEIQSDLHQKNISISLSEISFLGKRFIVYLAMAHKQCQVELKQYMKSNGGYILHMDGTCEGGSPHLFSCIDQLSDIVLGNRKMPTENSKNITELLLELKFAYGNPIALVHDMGSAILKSVHEVFPGIPDYICHFHFLRDIGKDLFDCEYRNIRRHTRSFNIKVKLRKSCKTLNELIKIDQILSKNLEDYLKNHNKSNIENTLDPTVKAYLLISWVLESASASNGMGFPFDHPHLDFYLRLQEVYPALKQLKKKGIVGLPISTINRVLTDKVIVNLVSIIQEKIGIFDELRKAMRIAGSDNKQGLNDNGDNDIKTIESQVTEFRQSAEIVELAKNNICYFKMVKQIDKYWEKLFADPIEIKTPDGIISILPQRTNNLMELSFRFLKQKGRKKSGQRNLTRALKSMIADTPLVNNLTNSDYMEILLNGSKTLAQLFSVIDIEQVRREEKENEKKYRQYPKGMGQIFKVPHLPQKLGCSAAK